MIHLEELVALVGLERIYLPLKSNNQCEMWLVIQRRAHCHSQHSGGIVVATSCTTFVSTFTSPLPPQHSRLWSIEFSRCRCSSQKTYLPRTLIIVLLFVCCVSTHILVFWWYCWSFCESRTVCFIVLLKRPSNGRDGIGTQLTLMSLNNLKY